MSLSQSYAGEGRSWSGIAAIAIQSLSYACEEVAAILCLLRNLRFVRRMLNLTVMTTKHIKMCEFGVHSKPMRIRMRHA